MNSRSTRRASIARGLALFFGAYALAGLLGKITNPRWDANLWWIDLRSLPNFAAQSILALFAFAALMFACGFTKASWAQRAAALVTGAAAVLALVNAITYWQLLASGTITGHVWVPISAVVSALLAFIARATWAPSTQPSRPVWMLTAFAAAVLLFPLIQVFGFGKTSYSRHADVAVVFGARVYADGRLSDAVHDRVVTAVKLYQTGEVQRLLMSGGPGDGAIHEAEAMRKEAIRLGVPADAIVLDFHGVSTAATVRNTAQLARAEQWRRIEVVSEFYHLPRIKLAYNAAGFDVFTVPAKPRHVARALAPANVAREVPAFWLYWLRAATGSTRA